MARMGGYKFLPLQDAHTCIDKKVNITAIILEFGFPKITNGSDPCRVLRIIDDTHHQTATTVIVFAKDVERLPRDAALGDIIQLWNVVVRTHKGEVNLVSYKSSSFALYKGEDNGDFVPYQAYSNFHPSDLDKMFVDKLRKWRVNFQLREDPSDFPMFREIKEGSFNLACKILHCWKAANDEWFVFVWDGTDAPPNVISSMLYDERMSLNSRTMHGRLPQSIGSLAQSSCITEVNHDRVGHSTLMDVLTHSEVAAKFKCIVRVVAALPHQPDNLCNSKGIYRMMLTLEDPTARIHAFVYDKDGEDLFGGYPSLGEIRKKLNRLFGVGDKNDDSLWAKDNARNPPWINVCIKSYSISETDVWGSRYFRIFDTEIVGDT